MPETVTDDKTILEPISDEEWAKTLDSVLASVTAALNGLRSLNRIQRFAKQERKAS